MLRPVKISDEPLLKDFFYSLSDESLYQRFISARKDVPHEMLQDFVVIDYTQKMVILAVLGESGKETIVGTGKEMIVGIGQYDINRDMHTADIALAVRDECQNQGLGTVLITYLTQLAKRKGLLGFTAEVLVGNDPVFRLFDRMGFDVHKRNESGIYEMKLLFKDID